MFGITKKLAATIVFAMGVCVLPVLLLSGLAFESVEASKASSGVRLQDAARNIADKIDRNLFERYGDVQAFGLNAVVRDRASWYEPDDSKNAITRAMNAFVDTYDVYLLTLMVDLEGKPIAVNTRDRDGRSVDTHSVWDRSFSGEPWFSDAVAGRFTGAHAYSEPGNDVASGTVVVDATLDEMVAQADPARRGYVLGFAAPVKDEDGKVIAIWMNYTDFEVVNAIAGAGLADLVAAGMPSAELTLLDERGRELLALGNPSGGGRPANAAPLAPSTRANAEETRRAQAGESGWSLADDSGINQVVGFVHHTGALGFGGMNWSLMIHVPEGEACGDALAMRNINIACLLACVVLIGLLGLWLVRRISTPIVGMTKAARSLALGKVDDRIEHQGRDEIGALAEALRGVTEWVESTVAGADALAHGDVDRTLHPRSDKDVLTLSLQRTQRTLSRLLGESHKLIEAAAAGRLSERGSTEGLEGAYGDLVVGLNRLMQISSAPIAEANSSLQRIAANDLTARVVGDYAGDWAVVRDGINSAADGLANTLRQVRSAAEQVATAAGEVSIGSQTMAQSTMQQASALEEITSNLHEITSSTKQTAGNAQQAQGMAKSASEAAVRGEGSMAALSTAIAEIKSASDKTAQIVKTIDEIAFQTNLLALNAAVEAARAGDAGKGFAVVADEVRNLAMRSAEAARTTADMIANAVKSAEQGVDINLAVKRNFDEIRGDIDRVVEVMSEIAAAADYQAQGVTHINKAIEGMSRTTQTTAATTEESASAAEEMSGQARALNELVAAFSLGGEGSDARAANGPPPARMIATGGGRPAAMPRTSSTSTRTATATRLIPFDDDPGDAGLAEF